jgi:hypothetical protein
MAVGALFSWDHWVYITIMTIIAVSYTFSLCYFMRQEGKRVCMINMVLLLAVCFACLSIALAFVSECYLENWCYYVFTV